ncbi:glutathione S-transferase family protein [Acidomonas methanolica]|uniref:Glutathione S-transferase n=1 Tax=Acidomonas methanolica NBRC 104435 TaxID=1231351 RepID=A0A023D0F7_ACIMT|nr:glutathione S-transferase family protein [Acidomonas methanolica]MBU2653324.1 glutathione S-transferase family protein [Acidomonas methanolica]TCS32275.1 glutathione S-transferase [Acidomonas methanolica]GAJ27648.1 glutathione S-transferase [Acidomonas methanolica NBRC 104435]GBQ54027.1 glutathione S-transferase [Acidomonas methanolica]GEK97710.1 glutathione S-transferase [Acidomonas methanolica NBRC 104435]
MSESQANRLVIGTRRYSSWSLRGWLAVRIAGLDVVDVVIPLRGGGQTTEIHAISPNGLVPYLEHDGARVWESLAICEYCAEFAPSLWPAGRIERAHARSMASEMHGGFRALRQALPMNLGRIARARAALDDETLKDIRRVDDMWRTARQAFGGSGPYLFGAEFTVPDIMFAPVVTRFDSYAVSLSPEAAEYAAAVLDHPLLREWQSLAAAEPTAWRLAHYESLE